MALELTLLELERRRRGWTTTALARAASANISAISQVERKRLDAWPALRRRLAAALGMPEHELFDAKGRAKTIEIAV